MYHWIDSWLTWQMYVAWQIGLLSGMAFVWVMWKRGTP